MEYEKLQRKGAKDAEERKEADVTALARTAPPQLVDAR
jgi:hypothetical protein